MGILSSIGKVVKGALDANLAVFAAPGTTLTKGVSAGIAKVEKQSAVERTAKIIGTTAVAAGAVLGAGTAAGRAVVGKVATSLVPKTTIGKAVAGTAGVIAVQSAVKAPKKAAEFVLNAPKEYLQFTGDASDLVTDPSLQNVKDLITGSPILTTATGLFIAGGAVKAAAPIIGGVIARDKPDEVIVKESSAQAQSVAPVSAPVKQEAIGAVAPTAPVTPQTQTVTKTRSKTRRKRRTASKRQSVNQRVNIVISNRATGQRVTNKYLKEAVLV